jgi:hypothetical protein
VRVVAKHRHELKQVRDEIRTARKENQDTITKMQEQQVVINGSTEKIKKSDKKY